MFHALVRRIANAADILSSMYAEATLLTLVSQIYDAAADSSRWPAFLEDFTDAVEGSGTALNHYHQNGVSAALSPVVRRDPYYIKQYCEYFWKVNPWLAWTKCQSPASNRSITTSEERLSSSELQKTEFYNDHLLPSGLAHQFGLILEQTETSIDRLHLPPRAAKRTFRATGDPTPR